MNKPYPKGITPGGGGIEPYDPDWERDGWPCMWIELGGNLKPLGMKPTGI